MQFILFIYQFLAILDLHCCKGFPLVVASHGYSLAVVSHGYSLAVVCRLFIEVVSLVVEHRL